MPARKKYTDPSYYESKLYRVMERLGPGDYSYNFDRHGAWVQFRYKGQLYQFDHSVDKAQEKGQDIHYGSDCFAQIVLALEDLTRIVERGIYDFQTWVAGMQYLPPPVEVPGSFRALGFKEIPGSSADIKARFRTLAKKHHPDVGGTGEDWAVIEQAAEQALKYMESISESLL